MRAAAAMLLVLALSACGGDRMDDLKQFVADSGKGLRGKVPPVPEVKPYEPFTYNAFDLPDPFKPRALKPSKGGGAIQPDLNRPKEALEAYPLESLTMVGTMEKDHSIQAIIKTPDKSLYRVKVGNHMGQNFGLITRITDSEVDIKEIVQGSGGDWTERTSSIQLQEQQEQKK